MPNILMVCTANQIRSPLAQEFLKEILAQRGLEAAYQVTSAGTWAADNQPALPKAVSVGRDMGVDLSNHQSRMVTKKIIADADLVLTMEYRQKEALTYEFPEQREKIFVLTEMIGNGEDISDPVSGSINTYQAAGKKIYQILEQGLDEILRLANQ